MNEFNYYWNGKHQTRADDEFLLELTKDSDNQEEITEGIKQSKESFDKR